MAESGGFPADKFNPFLGITFSDTRIDASAGDGQLPGMADNFTRHSRLGGVSTTVIVMNPPWSSGQKSSDDGNPNLNYPHIEQRGRDLPQTSSRSHRTRRRLRGVPIKGAHVDGPPHQLRDSRGMTCQVYG